MPRNKVYAIVEGQGEADPPTPNEQPAVVTLTLRLLQHFGCYDLYPAPRPWRLRSSGEFFRDDVLERALLAHTAFADCAGVLVLMDLEDDCPGLRGLELAERIRNMGDDLPFAVVVTCAYLLCKELSNLGGWCARGIDRAAVGRRLAAVRNRFPVEGQRWERQTRERHADLSHAVMPNHTKDMRRQAP